MFLLAIDWSEGAALLTGLLAISTFILAAVTYGMVRETRVDRRLGMRPLFAVRHSPEPREDPPKLVTVTVGNIGMGTALACWLGVVHLRALVSGEETVYMKTAYYLSLPSLPVGSNDVYSAPQSTEALIDVGMSGLSDEPGWTEVVLCRDVLGNKHRFYQRPGGREEWETDADYKKAPEWVKGW
jgi:hypothetical protein